MGDLVTNTPAGPPGSSLDLLRHVDCVVMLVPADASEAAASMSWAASFAKYIRVVVVTLDAEAPGEASPVVDGRLIRLTLAPVSTTDRNDCLNRALRRLGLISPLLWLAEPAHAAWFCTSYAAFKIIALWNRSDRAFDPYLSHADATLIAPPGPNDPELPPAIEERAWVFPPEPTESQVAGFCQLTGESIANRFPAQSRLKIAILYDHTSTYTNTVREYLTAFAQYSRHRVFFVPASNYHPNPPPQIDLSIFDVVVIHYSIRLCFNTLLPVYARALENFGGLRLCFIQDEYDYTEIARQAMDRFGVHVVFTCVPEEYRERVYPTDRFPNVEFVQVLTGYVPLDLEAPGRHKPFKDRRFVLGYRGRALPAWYGDLSREKLLIGQRVRDACVARGVAVDIEWDDNHRIYGEQWYDFMRDCRATLGSESGSNVFDDHGDIRHAIQRAVRRNPDLPYETIHAKYIAAHEGAVRMNQVSPRIFEAIALRTALILFEGTYSGVVAPDLHYIPLKKDLSNLDDVLKQLADDDYLERLTARAWDDIVGSGRYSYRSFIQLVDATIDRRAYRGTGTSFLTAVVATRGADDRHWQWRPAADQAVATFSAFTTELIDFEQKPPSVPVVIDTPVAADDQVLPPRPQNPLQAIKWRIADTLYRHTTVYLSVRAVYRGVRTVLGPVRRGYGALVARFAPAAEAERAAESDIQNVEP